MTGASIDPKEIAKFSAMADAWWDPAGKFAPLHKFNPVRLAFIRDIAVEHFGRDAKLLKPFGGLTLLDIGCGGGLLSEPMARLGFSVTGVDASDKNVKTAEAHARGQNLDLAYRCATAEQLEIEGAKFDVILNMEVVEHVADLGEYLRACAALLAPNGIMFVATINKTLKSLALAKIGAEYVLGWVPKGTHDWNRFVPPALLRAILEDNHLTVLKTQGVSFDPLGWEWRLSRDTDVNYMMVAGK